MILKNKYNPITGEFDTYADYTDDLNLKEDIANKGVPNGYASLDPSGKIPNDQMPISAMIFKGNWDANTNTPTLDNADTDVEGNVYRVSVAGTVDFGAGAVEFAVGDWCYSNGTEWQKGDNTDQVVSVFGRNGAVSAQSGDYNADQISETASNKIMTSAERTKLAGIEPLADVTDSVNVDGAGAVMNTDTTTADMQFVVDEDNMISDSATKVPTQQSVKAYVDSKSIPPTLSSTGVLSGGVLSTGGGSNQYSISDGTGVITSELGVITNVSWTGKTNIVPTNLATNLLTWVAIDSNGDVFEQTVPFTATQARSLIILGVVVHVNLVDVDNVNNEQVVAYQPLNTSYDIANALGFVNISGNEFSANGANLNIDKSIGVMFKIGSNYDVDTTNPHNRTLAALSPATFQYRFSNGSNGVTGTNIDPNNLDNGAGGLTAIANNQWSVQRIYSFTSNNVKIQRGVQSFATKAAAIEGLKSENYVTEPSIAANGLLRGWLVVEKGCTDLSDTSQAVFLPAPKFGEGSTGGASSPAGDASAILLNIKKATAGSLSIGQVVRATGYDGENILCELADADAVGGMPAIGVVRQAATDAVAGVVIFSGILQGVNTASFSIGDALYVSTTAGALTNVRPTALGSGVQTVARVLSVNAITGVIQVVGAGRINDIPNFTAPDKFWYGGATGQATEGTVTAAGRALLDDADAAAQRTTLNVDVAGTDNSTNVTLGGTPNDTTDDTLNLSGQEITVNLATTSTDGAMSAADKTKLDGVEALADVTDATNVDAAGAVMNTDTSTSAMQFVIDEDNMVSNSDTKVPTQQSVKAYVDAEITAVVSYQGGYDANTNTPDLDTTPIAGITRGDVWDVTVAGTFFTIDVEVGDSIRARQDNPTLESHWVIVQSNLTPASIKTQYESNANTNAFTDAEQTKLAGIEAGADVTDTANVTAAGALMDSEVDANIKTLVLPASTTITAYTKTLLDDADAATARATLGLKDTANFWLSAEGAILPITAPAERVQIETTTNKVNMFGLKFDDTIVESVQFALFLPEDYNGGTITAKFVWSNAGTVANNVIWRIKGVAYAADQAQDSAFGSAVSVTQTDSTTANLVKTSASSSAVTIANAGVGRKLQLHVDRFASDAGDTLVGDCTLYGVLITYTKS